MVDLRKFQENFGSGNVGHDRKTTGVAAPGGGYVTKPVGCGAQTGCVVGEAKIATAVYSEGNMVLVSTILKITKIQVGLL